MNSGSTFRAVKSRPLVKVFTSTTAKRSSYDDLFLSFRYFTATLIQKPSQALPLTRLIAHPHTYFYCPLYALAKLIHISDSLQPYVAIRRQMSPNVAILIHINFKAQDIYTQEIHTLQSSADSTVFQCFNIPMFQMENENITFMFYDLYYIYIIL